MKSFPSMNFFMCSALMPVRIFWLPNAPSFVAYFRTNLDHLTIVSTSRSVYIFASFLWLGFLGRILLLFFFIYTVIICCFLHIPPGEVLVRISFLNFLCALLGDIGVSFRTHIFRLDWVEALFEVLTVHFIEERSIGEASASASTLTTPTTASPSAATAFSSPINWWYPSTVDPKTLAIVALLESKGFSDLGCHIVHISDPTTKLVIIKFGIGQRYGQIILNLNPINQLLQHFLLSYLFPILCDRRKYCLQACGIFCKREVVLVLV